MDSLLQNKSLAIEIAAAESAQKLPCENPACLTAENFHEFFLKHSKLVLNFIYAMIPDRPQAEELCQEAFIRAFRKLDSRDSHCAPAVWIFGIARNVIREAIREKYRRPRQVTLDDPAINRMDAGSLDAGRQILSKELHHHIQKSLNMLAEDQRLVFILKIIHKLKYEEIAAITGASIPKLKTDLHRARLEMQRNLQPYLYSGSQNGR